jgi:DNA gyrase/topoisomerase IV subunit A
VVECGREGDAEKVLGTVQVRDLQVTFGVNLGAIADGKPRLMSLRRVLRHYIRHQRNVVEARTRYELERAKARAHILAGLMIAVDNLDAVIALIRQSKTPKEAKTGLMDRFGLDDVQAQAVLDLRLQRLTGLEIETLRKEYAELLALIKKLEAILADERKLMKVVKDELKQVAAEYGDDRRTAVEHRTTSWKPRVSSRNGLRSLPPSPSPARGISGAPTRSSTKSCRRSARPTTTSTTCPCGASTRTPTAPCTCSPTWATATPSGWIRLAKATSRPSGG